MAAGDKAAFDAGMLILLLQEGARAPVNPKTKEEIDRPVQRIEFLRDTLVKDNNKIVIPTPSLAEFLVRAGEALDEFIDQFDSDANIQVEPFSQRAAIEAAIMQQQAASGEDAHQNTRQVVKVDRQIVAVAKICNAKTIYTTDADVMAHAAAVGLAAIHIADLPLPPDKPQRNLEFDDSDEEENEGPESESAGLRRSGDGPSEGPAAGEEQAEAEEGNGEEAPI